jgi:hypothetical protein
MTSFDDRYYIHSSLVYASKRRGLTIEALVCLCSAFCLFFGFHIHRKGYVQGGTKISRAESPLYHVPWRLVGLFLWLGHAYARRFWAI